MDRRVLILLAGYPATGKSYLANLIEQELGAFSKVSLDCIKESLFDAYGYDSIEEREFIVLEAWIRFYSDMRINMYQEKPIMSDYPFGSKQYGKLKELVDKFGYRVITIRLTGDLHVLYERATARDMDSSRHLSHIMSYYHAGDKLEDRQKADAPLTYEVFEERCRTGGYGTFSLGSLVEIDVTDFSKVDYSGLLNELNSRVGATPQELQDKI